MKLKKIIITLLATVMLCSLSGIFASAEDEIPALYEIYKNHKSYTMVVSRKGCFANAPENSLPAIHSAENSGADIIEIDIRSTADGVLVLMEDESVERTCYGYGENTVVSEMTYNEIKNLKLLSGQGGVNTEKTQETVPTLEDVFKDRKMSYLSSSSVTTEQKALFMLDFDWSSRDNICNLVIENNMQNEVIFYIDDAKPDEIRIWKESLPFEPMIMTYFKGNVIFAATANVKDDAQIADGIHLATKNPYGVIFGKTVHDTAYKSEIRTMATPCIPEICGNLMQDTEVWWDYLVSKGFNVIMTDNISGLKAYLKDCSEKEQVLEKYFHDNIKGFSLPDFNSDKFLDYKRAYNNALNDTLSILDDGSSARSDIVTAQYEIQKAYNDIFANYNELEKGTAGMTVTPVRILLCIAAAAVIITAEVYVYKQKKK